MIKLLFLLVIYIYIYMQPNKERRMQVSSLLFGGLEVSRGGKPL